MDIFLLWVEWIFSFSGSSSLLHILQMKASSFTFLFYLPAYPFPTSIRSQLAISPVFAFSPVFTLVSSNGSKRIYTPLVRTSRICCVVVFAVPAVIYPFSAILPSTDTPLIPRFISFIFILLHIDSYVPL